MSSGKRHAADTSNAIIVIATVITTIALVSQAPGVVGLVVTHLREVAAFVTGLIVGHYATPDVRDQHRSRNEGERMVTAHFGKAAGKLWSLIWWLPAWLIPHRSPWSHLPVFATAIAALWLYAVPLALCWWYDVQVPWVLVAWHVAGWAVQDAVHLRGDGGLRKGIRW